ncbi:hypothetical protein D1920_12650 [Rhodopseudomonas palustris]|nr:hypothetical protein D1920_12650 [Rhodopseudomonas palustris]
MVFLPAANCARPGAHTATTLLCFSQAWLKIVLFGRRSPLGVIIGIFCARQIPFEFFIGRCGRPAPNFETGSFFSWMIADDISAFILTFDVIFVPRSLAPVG